METFILLRTNTILMFQQVVTVHVLDSTNVMDQWLVSVVTTLMVVAVLMIVV